MIGDLFFVGMGVVCFFIGCGFCKLFGCRRKKKDEKEIKKILEENKVLRKRNYDLENALKINGIIVPNGHNLIMINPPFKEII